MAGSTVSYGYDPIFEDARPEPLTDCLLYTSGNFLAFNQELAIHRFDVMQRPCGMAHDADRLAGRNEGLDQFNGMLVFGEIPHRAMAARVEDGIEVFLLDAVEANGLIELSFRGCVLLEPDRELGTGFGFVTLGIERRPAAFGGCERDLDAGVLENVVGGCELFEPESCLSSSVTQLVVCLLYTSRCV